MFGLLENPKSTLAVIQREICDLQIMLSVYKLNMKVDVISTANKCRCLISTLI